MSPAPRLDRLVDCMAGRSAQLAIAEGKTAHSYGELLTAMWDWDDRLDGYGIAAGAVVGIRSDFGFSPIALALALFRRSCVVVFLSPKADQTAALADCRMSVLFGFEADDKLRIEYHPGGSHPLIDRLREARRPGFVVLSSGSSGKPKAILHDLDAFFSAYDRPMKPMRTLAFLLFDHIAGLDTLFYTLHAGGALVLVKDRSPQPVCQAITYWLVETLPASPSFLKLLCLSDAGRTADLGSLRIVTFGSEPMDAATLARVSERLPHARLLQKYGASEFGAPSVRTREDNGLWIRFHGDAARVENGMLWVRAPGTMLGYLNADQPPMRDGWLCTGDRVEEQDGWLHILGRDSELINVGGEKVFPSEVEAVISELDVIAEVAVSGEKHPLMGQIVSATVRPRGAVRDMAALRSLVRSHCMKRLTRYKVPAKITVTDAALFNDRQKRVRTAGPDFGLA